MSVKQFTYETTAKTCYLALTVQAAVANFTPILLLTLRDRFSLSFDRLGLLVTVNFLTQLVMELTAPLLVDKRGYRPFLMLAHAMVAAGFVLFGLSAAFLQDSAFVWLLISTMIFAVGGGLGEILYSPVLSALPSRQSASAMAFLHSFYSWGQVGVVLLTTLLLYVLGAYWPWISALWVLLAASCAFFFAKVPLPEPVRAQKNAGGRSLFRAPYFWAALTAIFCGAMVEIIMSQWASAYLEKVVALPKLLGDVAGICLFAAAMGAARLLYGLKGQRINMRRVMFIGAALAVACYLAATLSSNGVVALVACALTGLGCALLWPGALSLSAQKFPLAGTRLFSLMTAAGSIGGALGPWLFGAIADRAPSWGVMAPLVQSLGAEQAGMRAGMLVGVAVSIAAAVGVACMRENARAAFPNMDGCEGEGKGAGARRRKKA